MRPSRFVVNRRRLAGVCKRLIVTAIVCYLTFFIVILINQRKFIFHPVPLGETTPANYEVPFEAVSIPVDGGGAIYAWWNRHLDDAPRPTMVYCHGNGASLSSYGKVSQIFYRMGWNALFFDYRGYGKSDVPAEGLSEASTARDAEAAYRWVVSKVPERSVVIWGHSLGSSIAARLSAGKSPAGVVLEGAFPSMYDMALDRYPSFPIFPFMILDKFATAEYVKSRSFPVLVVHAEHDAVIPLRYGKELYDGLSAPKQWLLLTGVGHNDYPSVHEQYDATIAAHIAGWIQSGSGLKPIS